ncbi:MAG: ATP phosphoribosyltransferase regulatory subunit [Methylomonas sp.]|nr:ATP phosphoribosyltransferase regulatory subunit [Methylomonas sp.]PPD22382.1 MAG: ATP phosphoribosyltransferase regulatory subunit [Methylomonas sp.]PPD25871.1 MAG: ATP phosphoribosyltransferase regulatory subunit [Methylomonas sp.]PPD37319.1 MAG: ATP phosphoribosyltransferase regulatory subunit [Methylomonas sp.]PPD42133.1 MAG: ATP phosphoribosyltransferase regulatory subunit [Methylomonas sp.]
MKIQKKDPWLLPEGITEVLPDDAARLEGLRRTLLDTFATWGYQLVIPPFVDFLDSLLTGSGHDLDLQTFKLTDQLSGKLLGVRSDMTPQVARIDAHNLHHDWPTRLCYVGTTLQTLGDALEKNRSPMQIGAELYGHAGIESDYEIICLMLEMLAISGLQNVHLDLGHVGIYRALADMAGLDDQQEAELFEVLQRKARPELFAMIDGWAIDTRFKTLFNALPTLNGGADVIERAASLLTIGNPVLDRALADLRDLASRLSIDFPSLAISFDLAELRGYHYHTGIVFAAFVPTVGREIARGGRYDNIGGVFGRARPATGFSADLKVLASLLAQDECEVVQTVFAPAVNDRALTQTVRDLRVDGLKVIQQLPGQMGGAVELGCNAVLQWDGQRWVVNPHSP